MTEDASPRWRQRRRTRKDLLQAAARLARRGERPSLDQVAVEAMVSRATAYRYFPNVEALLIEASLDVAVPGPEVVFAADAETDPVARMERVEAALHDMIDQNEVPLRLMLARAIERRARDLDGSRAPVRQDRRTPLIEAALAPVAGHLAPADRRALRAALALVVGTEAMIVCRDVLQLDDREARRVRRWAIRALVEAAGPGTPAASPRPRRHGGPGTVDRGAKRR